MTLPLPPDYPPMEAELASSIPADEGWLYEPKWDGFRCLAFRDGGLVELRSKAGKPLGRYFPELIRSFTALVPKKFVLDGEIVIPVEGDLVFDQLLLRIHPAESRVKKLSAEHPAHFIAFDLLVDPRGQDLTARPLASRRAALEAFASGHLADASTLHLSPATDDAGLAGRWLAGEHGGLDGVMAKRLDLPYASGERSAMRKVKRMRTAECVVGGFRWSKNSRSIGSLLLGLYAHDGKLHHVGFCSALNADARSQAEKRILPLQGGEGFSGRAPSGQSRWRKEGSGAWEPVRPEIVVEVEYDHFSGGRFRHGTRFLRWRPDKDPATCSLEQIESEGSSALSML
jgi:ATP-dependent DNA ligase